MEEQNTATSEFGSGNNLSAMLEAVEAVPTELAQAETPAQADDSTASGENTNPEPESSSEPGLIKIGDIEMTEADWLASHKDRENKQKWIDKNTKLGQLYKSKFVTPENLELVLPYAIGNKPIPQNIKESLQSELPKEVEIEILDEDGEPTKAKVPLNSILNDDLMNKIKQSFVNEYFPEYGELKETAGKYQELQQEYETQMAIAGSQVVQEFVKDKPYLRLTVPDGKTLQQQMEATLRAGEDHPEFKQAVKLFNLMKLSKDTGQSIDAVYRAEYAEQIQKEKQAQAIKQNQSEMRAEKPGEGAIQKSEEDQWMERTLVNPHKAAVDKLLP